MSNVTTVTLTSGVPTSPSGTVSTLDNLIGVAGTPSAQVLTVQGVSGGTNIPVSQATAANLNATVVGTGTFAVQAAATLAAETTKVIGTVNISAAQTIATVTAVTAITNALPAGTAILGKVGIDQTTDGTTNKVAANLRHSDGTIITDATGIKVSTSQLAALATAYDVLNNAGGGQKVYLPTDQAVLTTQLAASGNLVSGAITSAMTGTTSTSLVAAPGANLHNYITTLIVSNSHATVGTDVIIQDGSGGTTLLTIPAAAVYGGAVITLPAPLRQPTANTALFCANVTTGASTKVSAVGFKAA